MSQQIRNDILRNSQDGNINEIKRLCKEYVDHFPDLRICAVQDTAGHSILSLAAAAGHADVVEFFLDHMGAEFDVDQASMDGTTPLLNACLAGQFETASLLIDAGQADPNKSRCDGVSPLIGTCQQGHSQLANFLLTYTNANAHQVCNDDTSPLWYAALNGMNEIVTILIAEKGVSLDKCRNDDCTPLFMAAANGHADVVCTLLAAGADPALPRLDGATALHVASRHQHLSVVEVLLRHDKSLVMLRDKRGRMPMHRAARGGALKVAQTLHSSGAPVDAIDHGGSCVVSEAAVAGHESVISWLLRVMGEHPSPIATVSDLPEMAALPWNKNTPVHLAAACGHKRVLERLLKYPPLQNALNMVNLYGYTPLHLAVLRGHANAVGVLMNYGADPLVLTRHSSETALQIALRIGEGECAKHLGNDRRISFTAMRPRSLGKKPSLRYLVDQSLVVNGPNPTIRPTIVFLSRRDFVNAGKIPPYAICLKNDLLSPSSLVEPTDQVLYVSHRWDGESVFDPSGQSHSIIVDFLRKEGRRIRWIWCAYSCLHYGAKSRDQGSVAADSHRSTSKSRMRNLKSISQSQQLEGSKERKSRLLDTAGVLLRATHCLVLPTKLEQTTPSNLAEASSFCWSNKPDSALEDYMHEIRFYSEVLGSYVCQCSVFCSFLIGEKHIFHAKIVEPEFASSALGFSKIANEMVKRENEYQLIENKTKSNLNLHNQKSISKKCCIVDLAWVLRLVLKIFERRGYNAHNILQKSLKMDLFNQSEIDGFALDVPEIEQLWERLGKCKSSLSDERSSCLSVLLYLVVKQYPFLCAQIYDDMIQKELNKPKGISVVRKGGSLSFELKKTKGRRIKFCVLI